MNVAPYFVAELPYGHGYVVKLNGVVVAGPFASRDEAAMQAHRVKCGGSSNLGMGYTVQS